MISSVYGKTMKNLREFNVIVNNEKDFLNHTSRPTHITHKNYAAIHEVKPVLAFNKPIYVGFTVQELSKWLMYDFHYNLLKKFWHWIVIYWDKQSYLRNQIRRCLWKILKHKHNFSRDEMVVGKMKVKYNGISLNEFVGLKSKIHSMLSDDGKESNTAKAINIATQFN